MEYGCGQARPLPSRGMIHSDGVSSRGSRNGYIGMDWKASQQDPCAGYPIRLITNSHHEFGETTLTQI